MLATYRSLSEGKNKTAVGYVYGSKVANERLDTEMIAGDTGSGDNEGG